MANAFAAHVEVLLSRLTALRSRAALDPAVARRVAGLRYWDGDCVS